MLGVTSVEVMQRINVSTNVCFITEGGKKLLTPDLGIIYKRHIKELAIDLTSMHFVEHVDVKYAREFKSRCNRTRYYKYIVTMKLILLTLTLENHGKLAKSVGFST